MRIEIETNDGKFIVKDYTAPAGEATTEQDIPSSEANAASGDSITSRTYSDADLVTRAEETLKPSEGGLLYTRKVWFVPPEDWQTLKDPNETKSLDDKECEHPIEYTKKVLTRAEVQNAASITVDGVKMDGVYGFDLLAQVKKSAPAPQGLTQNRGAR